MEVGEYVINKNRLIIGKVIEVNKEREEAIIKIDKTEIKIGFWHIAKHSKNIIDLIELGDFIEIYVEDYINENGEIIEDTETYEVVGTDIRDSNGNKTNEIGIMGENGVEIISFDNVRSILTKEQYENNCYRLEK